MYNHFMGTLQKYYKQSATYKIFKGMFELFADFLDTLGKITVNGIQVIKCILKGQIDKKELIYQCSRFGVSSLPITLTIVGMTSIIITSQVALEMVKQGGGNFIGMMMSILIVREVAVIMSGFAIISMIGSSLASELATMRVTEQIDALVTLSTNPLKYLVAPRLWAGVLVLPILVLIGDIIGIFGGYIVGVYKLGFNPANYITATFQDLQIIGIVSGLVKAAVFGFIISMMGCYHGYKSKGGAQGVGNATTNAVVSSSILILIFNYLITEMFFSR